MCNTPEYYSNAYAKVVNPLLWDQGEAHVGDIMFNGHPNENAGAFRDNALEYVGSSSWALLKDPILSPFYATEELLNGAPPMYFAVGGSESIRGDSTMLAQKAGMAHVAAYLDIYDGMWHVFPMYSEGCQNPEGDILWQGESAKRRTAEFLRSIALKGYPPCPPEPGRPATWQHYSEPGKGHGKNQEWFPSSLCGEAVFDPAEEKHWAAGSKPSKAVVLNATSGFSLSFVVSACALVAMLSFGLHIARVQQLTIHQTEVLLG